MGAGASIGRPSFFCHECGLTFNADDIVNCPQCGGGFVERNQDVQQYDIIGGNGGVVTSVPGFVGESGPGDEDDEVQIYQRRLESAARLFSLLNLASMISSDRSGDGGDGSLQTAVDASLRSR